MQLCSLVFVVTVAIAFVVRRTALIFARVTFVLVAAIVFASVFGILALAFFAATCRMTKFNTHIRQQFLALTHHPIFSTSIINKTQLTSISC